MRTNRTALLLTTLTLACSPTPDWPSLGHDTSSTFTNNKETKLSTSSVSRLGVAWKSKSFGQINGAPAVVADVVYTMSRTGVYAVRASDGALIWQNTTINGTASPTVHGNIVYVNSTASVLHALDASNGRQLWRKVIDPHPNASGFSSPVVHDRYVIVGSASREEYANETEVSTFRGSIVAYDRLTGNEIWRRYTVDPPHSGATVWSSVAVDPTTGLVFGTTGNNYTGQATQTSDAIFALRITDGSVVWFTQVTAGDVFTIYHPLSPDSDFGTNPILFEATIGGSVRRMVGAGQKSGTFWAMDRMTGQIVWSTNVSPGQALSGGMLNNGAYDGQRILVAGNLGTSTGPGSEPANNDSPPLGGSATSALKALNPANGAVLWEKQLPAWVWAPITVANGVGFVAYEKTLQAFNVSNGAKLYTYRTDGTITSAPVPYNGGLFFGSGLQYIWGHNDDTLHALRLDATGGGDAGPPPDAGNDSGAAATFTQVYQQVLQGNGCTAVFCHGGGNVGNLQMSSQAGAYSALVNVAASGPSCSTTGLTRVVPGNPGASLLLNKIANTPPACGSTMPLPPSPMVSAAHVNLVRSWIAAGAPNN